ncbi:hypothetical protein L484_010145 [Morus notabilis]|uniref:Uncharacterized protein n=1 Tax=Morus notabilis TaxID=981085 RepID=W9RJY2_9ROSA|nr:UPF0481 protein At3g47200 [Morus notabilis]EXB77320.1 hypothetical protein L484_010145 [Morus notabilis]
MSDENDGLIVDGAGRPEEEIQLAYDQHLISMPMVDLVERERDHTIERFEKEMKWPTRKEKNKERTVIQKVPETILKNGANKEHFKPKELSIGPIHAGDSDLFQKELKLKLAACYIKETGRNVHELYQEIENKLREIKMSFDEEVINTYSDKELIELLFLDGCAILGFIHSYVNKKLNMFPISNEKAALIQQDLFLLENQIPFTVLKVLMDFENEENLIQDFCRFIALASTFPRDITEFIVMDSVAEDPIHFLDLFRQVLLLKASHIIFRRSHLTLEVLVFNLFYLCSKLCCCGWIQVAFDCCLEGLSTIISGCMKYFRKRQSKKKSGHIKYSFRNVQELQKAGIDFKPSDSLTTISFHSPFFTRAQLMLPTLVVDNSTEKLLFNLVIFEMCLPEYRQNEEPWITSYVNLLDLLVDNDQDVKDLRDADILQNCLGTNTEVANLINRIGSKCFAPREDTYEDVKKKVEKHCRSIFRRKCSLWMTQVCHTHFSSPWTILALVAATAVLALTAVQTYYAAYPYH